MNQAEAVLERIRGLKLGPNLRKSKLCPKCPFSKQYVNTANHVKAVMLDIGL